MGGQAGSQINFKPSVKESAVLLGRNKNILVGIELQFEFIFVTIGRFDPMAVRPEGGFVPMPNRGGPSAVPKLAFNVLVKDKSELFKSEREHLSTLSIKQFQSFLQINRNNSRTFPIFYENYFFFVQEAEYADLMSDYDDAYYGDDGTLVLGELPSSPAQMPRLPHDLMPPISPTAVAVPQVR